MTILSSYVVTLNVIFIPQIPKYTRNPVKLNEHFSVINFNAKVLHLPAQRCIYFCSYHYTDKHVERCLKPFILSCHNHRVVVRKKNTKKKKKRNIHRTNKRFQTSDKGFKKVVNLITIYVKDYQCALIQSYM